MKEYSCVELIHDKAIYKEAGVVKGMRGVVMDPIDGHWLVLFQEKWEHHKNDIWYTTDIDIYVKEEDLKEVDHLWDRDEEGSVFSPKQ